MTFTVNKIIKLLKKPRKLFNLLLALIRGTYYIILYRIINNNIRISFPFYAYAPVNIIGPGTVFIGKSSRVVLNIFKSLTIVTLNANSIVTIGEKCLLGGLTIYCTDKVAIGDNLMSAASLINDSYFINSPINNVNRHNKSRDITIGNNVWIAAECIVLGGSRIGNDTVLSFGTCCHNIEVGEYKLVSGNPARRPLPIDNILRLMRIQ